MTVTIYTPDIQGVGKAYLQVKEALARYNASQIVSQHYEEKHPVLDQAVEAVGGWINNPTAEQAKVIYDLHGSVERVAKALSHGQALANMAYAVAWLCHAVGVEIRYNNSAVQAEVQQNNIRATIEYAGTAKRCIDSF